MQKYIFISYSTKNTETAFKIKDILEKRGFDIWLAPNDIPIGQRYANVIEKAIQNCTVLLLIMSRYICTSMWINKEIERAINYGKNVFGIKIEEFELNDEFKFLLSTTQLSPLLKETDIYSEKFERIVCDIQRVYNGEIPSGLPLRYPVFSKIEEEKTYDKSNLVKSAKDMISAFLCSKEDCINILTQLHYSEINKYVKILFNQLTDEQKKTVMKNLNEAYNLALLDPNLSGRKEYAVKGQIIYYITRLCEHDENSISKLKGYYYSESNIWQRQSIAYGLAALSEIQVPFDFAQKIYYDCDEAVINRSWTLVFFGDIQEKDAYLYLDDGKCDWTKCRTVRINRLKKNELQAQAFRSLDLCLLHSFLSTRGWELSQFEIEVVKNTVFDKKLFTKQQLRFLKTVQKEIVKNCKKQIRKK